ncbi:MULTISPECIES: hypothetical protein [unclassified Streptomyces]|uniref:hypothetical protein n=1 Tax=unclassified Streptomyces TaxID=2593676 RepID=UPI000DD63965|nr:MULTISPECIES: hypothetical protein [unclassified Streptomyces]QZZ29664.1 hypothetical protein A7X85_28530 [Streptomyces sp. ST1015]
MKQRRLALVGALLIIAFAATACDGQKSSGGGGSMDGGQEKMNEERASARSEEIIHQAVDRMSPKPTLKRSGLRAMGACVADEPGSGDRVQFRITYQLTGVPGSQAKLLVRQARDAWVAQGYKFQSSDADWNDPFPSINMRTPSDDFWMSALTGVVDRQKGEGLAAISVTSPCFSQESTPEADPASSRTRETGKDLERRVLDHSSRIYDALRVRHEEIPEGGGVTFHRDSEGIYAQHGWSTQPLKGADAVQAIARVRAYFDASGWDTRDVSESSGNSALVALENEDMTIARIVPSVTGALRIDVTTSTAASKSA